MNIPCLYAVVRLMPFVETDEFANVGVVAYAPSRAWFDFRLEAARHARVTGFFDGLDGAVYRRVLRDVQTELERLQSEFARADAGIAMHLWRELLKPRSTQIRLSEERVVLAAEPRVELDALFARYVERAFVTREYVEQTLNRDVAGWLRSAGFGTRFKEAAVGDERYNVIFPFVARDGASIAKAIKPLALTQEDSVKILEHGGRWIQRMRNLRKWRLAPPQVLFAYSGAADEVGLRGEARRDVVAELEDLGALVSPLANSERVLAFAADAPAG